MAGVGLAPRRPVVAEDIRDLQNGPRHGSGLAGGLALSRLQRGQAVERAHDVAVIDAGGDARVERRRIELGVSQRSRVIMHILLTH